jgi:hypothetical protein
MSQQEKLAWWGLGTGILIWVFLYVRFTEAGRIVDLPPGQVLETYVQMIVLWIVASVLPAVFAARHPESTELDERDRAIDALGDRWEGYVVVVAINALVVHVLARALFSDRTPSVPIPDVDTTSALVFALLTTLFLAHAVKQAVVLWQYRR